MAEGFALDADVRERTGKGAARALRRNGQIPAVIYGNNEPPVAIAIPAKETTLALYAGGFKTNIWKLNVGGQSVQVLARDYQREPVKDRLVHVDFLRVSARTRVAVDVPLVLVGEDESPAVAAGATPTMLEYTISVEAPAASIPDGIEVSIASAEADATITTDDITLPAGVTLVADAPIAIVSFIAAAAPAEDEAAGDGDGDAAADTEE